MPHKDAAAGRAWRRRWRALNLERERKRDRLKMRRYRSADPEKFRRRTRLDMRKRRQRLPNEHREWAQRNPLKIVGYSAARRARIKGAPGRGVSANDWAEILERHKHRCAYCGKRRKLEQDHVIPLARGGAHDPLNIAPACRQCNSSKHARLLTEWVA